LCMVHIGHQFLAAGLGLPLDVTYFHTEQDIILLSTKDVK
jgi:hypothetical protein